jgi:glycosyltransferase involved in cell wall biosynthesis
MLGRGGIVLQIIIEGWRLIPHSYSIVSQFLCLELLQDPALQLWHRDVPYLDAHWQPQSGLLDSQQEAQLEAIPAADPDQVAEVVIRIAYPYDLSPSQARRTLILATAECNVVPQERVHGGSLDQITPEQSDFTVVTLSNWSKAGLIQSGVDPRSVVVIPCGIDPHIYQPVSPTERLRLRQDLGWEGFVFLNAGAMIPSKGFDFLLRGFAAVVDRYPQARLVLKGNDWVYPAADDRIGEILVELKPDQADQVLQRLIYIGDSLSFREMARLYQAADAYVSPYLAEGFNMPVLEAIACGLPVICTAGGSTDDFTTPDFALRIQSKPLKVTVGKGQQGWLLIPDQSHLVELMSWLIEHPEFAQQAYQMGPQFVVKNYTWQAVADRWKDLIWRGLR